MNICLFTSTSDFGGAETMALAFLKKCDPVRFRPYLICLHGKGPVLDEARNAGIPCLGLEWRGLFDPAVVFRFRRFIKDNHIDLVHSFGLRADLISRLFAPGVGARRIVCGLRDTGDWRTKGHVLLDRLTSGRVDLFIANSEAARQAFMKREKFRPEKILTIHNGLEMEEDDPVANAPDVVLPFGADRRPVLIQVANYKIHIKGYDLLLGAVSRLKNKYPAMIALCVGKDFSGGALSRMIAEQGLADHVVATGYCKHPRGLLARADVFILPSRFESFPVSILEAMSSGVAVVAADVGGVSEIIRNEENGLLVAPEDEAGFAEAVDRLFSDDALRARLAETGRREVKERFSLAAMTKKIEEAYEGLLEN